MSALVLTTKPPRTPRPRGSVGFWRGLAILALILTIFWISIISLELVRRNTPVADLTPQFLLFLSMALMLLNALLQLNIARWSRNCEITLNDKALFYASGQKTFRWAWQDLSPFEMRTAKPFRSWWIGFSHIRIARQDEGAIKRFLQLWREPRVIVDAFDTSLEDITAQLNEYRDRALAASGTGAAG